MLGSFPTVSTSCSSLSLDLFSRNNVNVEGATHRQVVELIKSCGDTLTLTVISVSEDEAERLEPSGMLDEPWSEVLINVDKALVPKS